jgi:hypothetical protein
MEWFGSHWTDFHGIWYRSIFFFKKSPENSSFIKSGQNNGYFTWKPLIFFITSHSNFLRMRNVSTKAAEEIKTCYIQ